MKVTGVWILFCFVLAASLGAEASNDRTITKVVKLLESLLEKSKADGETDRDLYAKFKCYCDDNEDEKTLSIEELTKQIGILESHIEELRGSTGELSTECAQLRSDMEENEAARAEAEAIRKKAHEDFVAEEADLTSAIDQMDLAIKTLSDIGADQTMSVGADHTQYMAGHEALLRLKSTVKQALVAASVFFRRSNVARSILSCRHLSLVPTRRSLVRLLAFSKTCVTPLNQISLLRGPLKKQRKLLSKSS